VLVGHRAWDAAGLHPARPFGFGLGWTDWETRAVRVERVHPGGAVDLVVTVVNTGERAGTAVAQVYLEPPAGEPARAVRTLAGFATAVVPAGGQAEVPVHVRGRASQIWDVAGQRWVRPAGRYRLRAGQHSRDLPVSVAVQVDAGGTVSPTKE
jgi:beta-glucosidase